MPLDSLGPREVWGAVTGADLMVETKLSPPADLEIRRLYDTCTTKLFPSNTAGREHFAQMFELKLDDPQLDRRADDIYERAKILINNDEDAGLLLAITVRHRWLKERGRGPVAYAIFDSDQEGPTRPATNLLREGKLRAVVIVLAENKNRRYIVTADKIFGAHYEEYVLGRPNAEATSAQYRTDQVWMDVAEEFDRLPPLDAGYSVKHLKKVLP